MPNEAYAVLQGSGRPIVLEEFGYPRDRFRFAPGSPTLGRDQYYRFLFGIIRDSGKIAGCNFWGWGGSGRARAERWTAGDDFLCDPPHEPQGWYSVFDTDSQTIDLIRQTANKLHE